MNTTELPYFLFARPTFVTGIASILDFGNTLFFYNESPNGDAADYVALKNDWVVVGTDLRTAIRKYAAPEGQLELLPSDVG